MHANRRRQLAALERRLKKWTAVPPDVVKNWPKDKIRRAWLEESRQNLYMILDEMFPHDKHPGFIDDCYCSKCEGFREHCRRKNYRPKRIPKPKGWKPKK
jgi:hypothetical protein